MAKEFYEYRGWIIRPVEATHVGYKLPQSRSIGKRVGIGTHRKVHNYEILYPLDDGGGTKIVDTLKEAKAYIDRYLGE